MRASPVHCPAPLHPPVRGGEVGTGGSAEVTTGAPLGAIVGRPLDGPAGSTPVGCPGGAGPSDEIFTSAQLTNVSCFSPLPTPQSLSASQPQLFPVFHHHWITQWSHVRSYGSTSSTGNSPLPAARGSGQDVAPSGCFSTCVSFSWVTGGVPMSPIRNVKVPR